MTTFIVNRKLSQRQPKRRDRPQTRRHWTPRLELIHRIPRLDYKLRDQAIQAVDSRSHRKINLVLDAAILNQERADDEPTADTLPPTYPPLGEEIFNLSEEEIREAWRDEES
jgi:hypothetical protein